MKKFTLKWRAGAKKKTPTLIGSGNDLGANKKVSYDSGVGKKPTVAKAVVKPARKAKVYAGSAAMNKVDYTDAQKKAMRKKAGKGGSWR